MISDPNAGSVPLVGKCLRRARRNDVWFENPRFAELRSEARFQDLMRRMNFP